MHSVTELFNYLPAALVLLTFVRYLVAFCSLLEAASDVISGMAVEWGGVDVHIKFVDSRSNRS